MRIIVASLVSAIVLFVWGAISWMVLPWHSATINTLNGEDTVVAAINVGASKSGAYFFPAPAKGELSEDDQKAFMERHKKGPIGMIMYNAEGIDLMSPKAFIRGFALGFLASLIAAGIVAESTRAQASWVVRVLIVVGLGVFAGLTGHLALWNWMHFPKDWTVVMVLDGLVASLLSGVVIASIVKPTHQLAADTSVAPPTVD